MVEPPLLDIRDLTVTFRAGSAGRVRAVRGVSLTVARGETLSLVGESGSGKTTLVRAALRLGDGEVRGRALLDGEDILHAPRGRLRSLRRRVQLVFQDPFASLNPKIPVGRAVAEPLLIHGLAGREEASRLAAALLERVGLDPVRLPDRLPRDLSGGQRQRVAIARALAVEPDLLVLDEPVSALDVSEQARVLNLLAGLKAERGLAYLLIAHDLAVVRNVSDRVAVMYLGEIVEEGPASAVLESAAHPYTRALLASSPVPDPARPPSPERARGEPPSPFAPPPGCAFHPRCPLAEAACAEPESAIPAVEIAAGHRARCRLCGSVARSV